MTQYNRRNIVGCLLGVAFISVGVQHFARPEIFNPIVPEYLGWPSFWNYTSGTMEILFGLGMILPRTRTYAAQGLVVLVVCMSLANLNMWLNDIPFNGTLMSTTGHIFRLIAQTVLLATLLWLGEKIYPPNPESV